MSRVEISRINRGFVIRSWGHLSSDDIEGMIREVARAGGGSLRWFVFSPTDVERDAARRHGLVHDQPLMHMRCSLPLDARHRLPSGFVTRAFRPGVDDEEWLALNSRAFAAHPEQGDWTSAVLEQRFAEPWFDAAGFLVHDIDGRMAGFCWTKVHAESDDAERASEGHGDHDAVGEIYVIGVDPSLQGRGLGRALTIAGFEHLSSRGLHQGMLHVAGDNSSAISLYSSLGMTVAHHEEVFVGSVPAADAR